jgi:hypothetical protein
MKIKIGTIEQELKKCRAAFAAHPKATWAWCCHHEIHCEALTEPAENRIAFILSSKDKSEQAVRLLNFRPCKDAYAVKPARDAYAVAVKTAGDAYDVAIKPARDAYDVAVKPARDAYDVAVKTARDAHHAAVKPACAAYDVAIKPACAAYDVAVKTARDAYDVAVKTTCDAYDVAVKTADKTLQNLHRAEWPNNTWTGTSIFSK